MARTLLLGNASPAGLTAAVLLAVSASSIAAPQENVKPSRGMPPMANPAMSQPRAPVMPSKQPSLPSPPPPQRPVKQPPSAAPIAPPVAPPSMRPIERPIIAPPTARPIEAPVVLPPSPRVPERPAVTPPVSQPVVVPPATKPRQQPVAAPPAAPPPNWRPAPPPSKQPTRPIQIVESPEVRKPSQPPTQISPTPRRPSSTPPSTQKPAESKPSANPTSSPVKPADAGQRNNRKPIENGKPSSSKTPRPSRGSVTINPSTIAPKPEARNPSPSRPVIVDVPDIDQPREREVTQPKPRPTAIKPDAVLDNSTLAGVPLEKPRVRDTTGGSFGTNANTTNINNSVVNNSVVYNNYVSNVSYANGWGCERGWVPPCGPCDYWQPYDSDGFSFAIGFGGSGWGLGFFYGSGASPLCGSWGNPWWNGYATASYCSSAWNPCWNPCFPNYWSNCWWPRPAYYPYGCYPIYPYTPVWYTPYWSGGYSNVSFSSSLLVNTTTTCPVTPSTPPAVIAPLPSVDAMWSLLSDGFDQDAAQGFDQLVQHDANDAVSRVGEALAHAFGGDLTGATITMRQAIMVEPGVLARVPMNPALASRTTMLLDNLRAAVAAVPPSLDALYIKACCQALLGNEGDAYFTTTLLIREHDASASTLALQGWLDLRLRNPVP